MLERGCESVAERRVLGGESVSGVRVGEYRSSCTGSFEFFGGFGLWWLLLWNSIRRYSFNLFSVLMSILGFFLFSSGGVDVTFSCLL